MLAYCTAADLPSGLLVYADGETESAVHRIRNTGKTIEVVSLDLMGPPSRDARPSASPRPAGACPP